MIDQSTHHFCGVILGHGGNHGRGAGLQALRHKVTHRFERVAENSDLRCRFLHTFEFADFRFELATDLAERAGHAIANFTACSGQSRKRNTSTCAQAFNEHTPTFTGHFRATDDPVNRDKYIFAINRPIHEWCTGVVTATDFNAFVISRNQGTGNTVILGIRITQQAVRVTQLKCQANYRCHRRKCNPALSEVEANTKYFFAVKLALTNDTQIRDRTCVRSYFRAGQTKAWNLGTFGKSGQPAFFLLVSTVFRKQFAWAERVGNHRSYCTRDGAGCDFAHDAALSIR